MDVPLRHRARPRRQRGPQHSRGGALRDCLWRRCKTSTRVLSDEAVVDEAGTPSGDQGTCPEVGAPLVPATTYRRARRSPTGTRRRPRLRPGRHPGRSGHRGSSRWVDRRRRWSTDDAWYCRCPPSAADRRRRSARDGGTRMPSGGVRAAPVPERSVCRAPGSSGRLGCLQVCREVWSAWSFPCPDKMSQEAFSCEPAICPPCSRTMGVRGPVVHHKRPPSVPW